MSAILAQKYAAALEQGQRISAMPGNIRERRNRRPDGMS